MNINVYSPRKTLKLLILTLFVFSMFAPPQTTQAISSDQKRVIQSGARYYDMEANITTCNGMSNLIGSDNAEKVYNFLVSKGFTPIQTAGVMGNLQAESGMNPDINEQNPLVAGSRGGYGLAQWTGGRRVALENYASEKGVPVSTLELQLDFMWHELNGPEITAYNDLRLQTTVDGATLSFLRKYERAGIPHTERRIQFSRDFLAQYGSGTEVVTPGDGGCERVSLNSEGCPTDVISENDTVLAENIRVHPCIAEEVERIVLLANQQGLSLGGGGWRDTQNQIRLREQHGCGGSRIYDSSCKGSPPTATPGNSRHERGTAVDFTCGGSVINSRSHPCFIFLKNNTSLINLPSEPWHWSIDGR